MTTIVILSCSGITGEIHLNDQGVRRRHHSVAHYQGGQLVLIAEIADGYREVRSVEWPGGSLPTDQLQTPGAVQPNPLLFFLKMSCFKGNVGETFETRGGSHMGFPESIDTILN